MSKEDCEYVPCCVCESIVCKKDPCIKHPDGSELVSHQWVCSFECFEEAVRWHGDGSESWDQTAEILIPMNAFINSV